MSSQGDSGQPTALLGSLIGSESGAQLFIEIDGDTFAAVRELTPADAAADGTEVASQASAERVAGWLAPGFVDIHCHGGGGHSFTALDSADARATAEHQHAAGSTSVVASLVTMPPAELLRGVEILAELADESVIAGIHLEGPWLAESRCGAHDPALLRDPDPAEVAALIAAGRGHLKQVTFAPERAGAEALVQQLVASGIRPAIGHTSASAEQVTRAIAAGATIATHLFNGMDPWHHRTPGAVPTLLAAARRGEVTLELIADGTHLADGTAAAVFELAGPEHVAFVSDAMAAAGLGDGEYDLGALRVEVRDGVARLATAPGDGPGSIAGGTSHVGDIVARQVDAGIPLRTAVDSATVVPALALGLAAGVIEPGARADLVALDDAGRVQRVMRAGRWLT